MSESDTSNGSTAHSLAQDPVAGSLGTRPAPSRPTNALAWAISVARAPASRTARSERSGTAKKPHPEPTSARTPTPESASCDTESTSPFLAVMDSERRCITRASA